MALYIAMRSSVLSMATCSASARSDSAPTIPSAVDCAQAEPQPNRKTNADNLIDSPVVRAGVHKDERPGPLLRFTARAACPCRWFRSPDYGDSPHEAARGTGSDRASGH